ncbi:MAG: DUF503 domain-containing protein [Chloroflexi bacterium]|nr:DUF503 domain-containing protein [Chloroflexota bacterium]
MPAVVGLCTLRLSIPGNDNLKGKRRVLQSVMARLRESFNVAVAETGENDKWQVATLGIAAVANDAAYVHGLLTRALESIERSRVDATVLDYSIEIL